MTNLEEQLKNPVWYSLNETHKKFIEEFNGVQFYNSEVCTFGSFFDETKTAEASNRYLKTTDHFFFVSENQTPIIDDDEVFLEKKIDGCQMVIAHTTKEILKENKKPILHTNKGNPAIALYEKLGFELKRDMNWWLYRKK